MSNTVLSYPIPPYSNVPIEPQFYEPSRFVISAITLGQTTLITTTQDHNYVIGQLVRLIIPPSNGCRQLNEQQGYVLSIPNTNQVILNIYSAGGDPFVSAVNPQQPQILAIGDVNTGVVNNNGRASTGTYVPGSFINISPN